METEFKSLPLQIDDLSHEKGTATVAHAVFDNIDRVNDIARKGMFTKSWKEQKLADGEYDISFYLNHDDEKAPGRVTNVFEDSQKAYTSVKMGTHTLGADTLKMLDEKIIRNVSFGYKTIKAKAGSTKGIRELLEVKHLETSALTKLSANPKAGVVAVTKSFEGMVIELKTLAPDEQAFMTTMLQDHQMNLQKMTSFAAGLEPTSDLYTTANYWAGQMNDLVGTMKSNLKWNGSFDKKDLSENAELKAHLANLKKFVRNTSATDETVKALEVEIKSLEQILGINTANTQLITEPVASEADDNALADRLLLLTLNLL